MHSDPRCEAIIQEALGKIAAAFAKPDPLIEALKLARRYRREAWKLEAGWPVRNEDGTESIPHADLARRWASRLREQSTKQMQKARDIRFERMLFPDEPLPSSCVIPVPADPKERLIWELDHAP